MRRCQVCNKNEATWHITDIVGGELRELHLCDECARAKAKGQVLVTDFLTGLLKNSARQIAEMAKLVCPHCQATFMDFHSLRRLGCPHDYEAFGESMMDLLKKIHGATRHVGKVPTGADSRASQRAELRRLRQALGQAVKQEQYEQAALLRDRIGQMEEALGDAG